MFVLREDIPQHLTGLHLSSYAQAQSILQEAHALDFRKLRKNSSRAKLCVKLIPGLCRDEHSYQQLTDETHWRSALPQHPVVPTRQCAKPFRPALAWLLTTSDAGRLALLSCLSSCQECIHSHLTPLYDETRARILKATWPFKCNSDFLALP